MEYISPNTGQPCKPAHLIAELMVQRKFKGKVLPFKFWNEQAYKKEYKQQIIAATSVMKVYEPQAILAALSRKDLGWCYSLRFDKMQDAIALEQKKLDTEKKQIEDSEKIDTDSPAEFRIIKSGQKSLKSKLD